MRLWSTICFGILIATSMLACDVQQAIAQSQPRSLKEAMTIALFNNGADDLQRGDSQSALRKFEQCLQVRPGWRAAQLNLANAYCQLGRFEEAEHLLRLTSSDKTVELQANRNLVGICESTGRLADAESLLKLILRDLPSTSPDKGYLEQKLKTIQEEAAVLKTLQAAGKLSESDYYDEVFSPSFTQTFPASAMPLKVWINPQAPPGTPPTYQEILLQSFQEWSESSRGKVRFVHVPKREDANIRITWVSDPREMPKLNEAGSTQLFATMENINEIAAADIKLLVTDRNTGMAKHPKRMHFVCLHEIGHALGMHGHSHRPGDIMYYGEPLLMSEPHPTERDGLTVIKAYQDPILSGRIDQRVFVWLGGLLLFTGLIYGKQIRQRVDLFVAAIKNRPRHVRKRKPPKKGMIDFEP